MNVINIPFETNINGITIVISSQSITLTFKNVEKVDKATNTEDCIKVFVSLEDLIKDLEEVSTDDIIRFCTERIAKENSSRNECMNSIISLLEETNTDLIVEHSPYYIEAQEYEDPDFYHKDFYRTADCFNRIDIAIRIIKRNKTYLDSDTRIMFIEELLSLLGKTDFYDYCHPSDIDEQTIKDLSYKYQNIRIKTLFKVLAHRIENVEMSISAYNCTARDEEEKPLAIYKKYFHLCYILSRFNSYLYRCSFPSNDIESDETSESESSYNSDSKSSYNSEEEEIITCLNRLINDSNLFDKEFLRSGTILTIKRILSI